MKYPAKLPPKLDMEAICDAAERSMFGPGLGSTGFCLACGFEQDCCEPDAEGYKCEDCGEYAVCGAENILIVYGF